MANFGQELEQIVKASSTKNANKVKWAEGDVRLNGGISFVDNLRPGEIVTPGHPDFGKVYDLYARIFTLPSERETKDGFKTILGFNGDSKLAAQYGPMTERWVFLKHPSHDTVMGASNFEVFRFDNKEAKTQGTQHGSYDLSHSSYRRHGIGSRVLKLKEEATLKFLKEHGTGENPKFRAFNEQNNPLRMTVEEYKKDAANAGIDQCERLKFWQRRGYNSLDFGYVQPPLEAGTEPCRYLTLNIIAEDGKPVPASLVFDHLFRFSDFAVLKRTRDPMADPSFKGMAKELQRKSYVTVSSPDYDKLKRAIYSLNVKARDAGKPLVELIKPEVLRDAGYKLK